MPRVAMGSKHVRAVSSRPSIPGHGFCEKQTSSSVSYDYWPFSVIRWEIELRLSPKSLRDPPPPPPPSAHKRLFRPPPSYSVLEDLIIDMWKLLKLEGESF